MNRFIKGIGIFFTLIVVGVVSAFAVIALLLRQEEVRVPDLAGQDIVSVIEVVGQLGLQLKVDRRVPSQAVPRDAVISQTPPPGTGLKKGRALRVVVSQGPSELLAPRVVGEQYRKAEIILRQGGLLFLDIARVWSDAIERDVVIAQDPPAGTPIEKGGGVSLLVSLGKKGRTYVTPKLLGKKAEEAVRLIDRMGLQHSVLSRTSTSGAPGSDRIIVSQKPHPGYPLAADGVVELIVSK
ncbi:MAG: PASTA domain-containing protein [Nitrospirota bacterium]